MAKTGAETARERIAAGKCCSCSKPATRGVRCEEHWLQAKDRDKQRYLARQAASLCGMCGKNPKPSEAKCCPFCREKQNEARRVDPATKHIQFDKPLHQRNKEAGYCTTGGSRHARPQPGHTQCDFCLAKKRERHKHADVKLATNAHKRVRYAEKAAQGLCVADGCNQPATHDKMCEKHRLTARDKDQRKRQKLRDEVFAAYGGYRCTCPGCTCAIPAFIELDHINNDGADHRRAIAGHNLNCGNRMYYWLKKHGYPKIVQPMCSNCNKAKAHDGGKCPYEGQPH